MQHANSYKEHPLASFRNQVMCWLAKRSRVAVNFFNLRMETVILGWLIVMILLTTAKLAAAPKHHESIVQIAAMALPFLAITLAPVLGYRIAESCFPSGLMSAQPSMRLCRYGQWNRLDLISAKRSPDYGPTGFMASLLAGLVLNVPFRALEFMAVMPPMPRSAPLWAQAMMSAMTLDVITLCFFYMVCFVMALRSVPLFPRMLLFTWLLDVVMQFQIAEQVNQGTALPQEVAQALRTVLTGNIQKVLISMTLWLPYLILSKRVNITFRHRVRA